MIYLKKFESDNNPFFSHNLRMEKGYKPKYRSGLIAVRFLDDEISDIKDGEYRVNYQDLFVNKKHSPSALLGSKGKSDFIKYFEDRYDIKMSDYRHGSDDFYLYFKCKPGTEKEKIEEIAKDKIVKVVDYVDIRGLESGEELEDIGNILVELGQEFSENSDEEITKTITDTIERLKKLL